MGESGWLPELNSWISGGSQYLKKCSLLAVTKPRRAGPLDVVGQGRMRSWSAQGRSLLCPSSPIPQYRANLVRTCGTELSLQMALTTAAVMVSLDVSPLAFHTEILLWIRKKGFRKRRKVQTSKMDRIPLNQKSVRTVKPPSYTCVLLKMFVISGGHGEGMFLTNSYRAEQIESS